MKFLPDYQSLSFSAIKARISQLEELGKPEQDFLYANITDWLHSDRRKLMQTAQKYYKNEADITERKRYYIDRKGNQQEAKNLSNSRLCHPFMKKLTNQKVNYLLSKEFTINAEDEAFAEKLGTYLDKRFLRMLKNIGRDAVVNGLAWLQVYYDATGELKFKRIPSDEVIPFWADAEHTVLDAVIRVYSLVQFQKNGYKKDITKIEYHTRKGVWYFVMGEKGLEPDPEMGGLLHGHFTAEQNTGRKDENGNPIMSEVQATWEQVPFVAFKYNPDELSLLKWVKSLIDDYDLNTSDTSNNLQDVPNSIKVVRNYDGTDKGEFVQNLATFRTAFVGGDGDMSVLNTPLDTTAIDAHLNRLRRDIYDAGNGVDMQDENLGNASGVALKFRYAGLDSDAMDMATEFVAAMEDLVWFIKTDMAAKGMGDYTNTEFDIVFNTDIIINEAEVITAAKNSVGVISDETIVANHPWVTDAVEEMDKLKKQKEEAMQESMDMMAFENGFGENSEDDNKNDNKNDNSGGDE